MLKNEVVEIEKCTAEVDQDNEVKLNNLTENNDERITFNGTED